MSEEIRLNEYIWILLSPRNLITHASMNLRDVLNHDAIKKPGYKVAKIQVKATLTEEDIIDHASLMHDTGVRYDP